MPNLQNLTSLDLNWVLCRVCREEKSCQNQAQSPRSAYYDFQTLQTRWEDNDAYGHMNNIVHYSLIDTAVTNWQRDRGFFEC